MDTIKKYITLFGLIVIFGSCQLNRSIAEESMLPLGEQTQTSGKIMPILQDGKYINPFPPDPKTDETPFGAMLRGEKGVTRPAQPLPFEKVDIAHAFSEGTTGLCVTWLGHSSLLIQIDGVRIAIDPVFSMSASPVFFFPVKRYQEKPPITAEELPFLDAVFLSHNHYDHLDKKTILELAPKTGRFIIPMGVGEWLRDWGIEDTKISEYSWWDEGELRGISDKTLRFACTPARHFSGRSPFSISKSLWVSWVFMGSSHKMFYSGDGSYNYHFKQIGHHYGPFDLTLVECGQYNTAWSESHMFPEQSVQAHLDVLGKYMIPIHWGSFSISRHDWWEPPERASVKAGELGVNILTPRVGQTLQIYHDVMTVEWWREFKP